MTNTVKKIYAVTSGSYSDYRVVALFTSIDLANDFMAAVPSFDYNSVEQFELNPDTVDLIKRGYSLWSVQMLRNGDTESVKKETTDSYSVSNTGHRIWRRTQSPMFKGKGFPDLLISSVWAKSEDAAVKIANEHRAQMIASGEWDTEEQR